MLGCNVLHVRVAKQHEAVKRALPRYARINTLAPGNRDISPDRPLVCWRPQVSPGVRFRGSSNAAGTAFGCRACAKSEKLHVVPPVSSHPRARATRPSVAGQLQGKGWLGVEVGPRILQGSTIGTSTSQSCWSSSLWASPTPRTTPVCTKRDLFCILLQKLSRAEVEMFDEGGLIFQQKAGVPLKRPIKAKGSSWLWYRPRRFQPWLCSHPLVRRTHR